MKRWRNAAVIPRCKRSIPKHTIASRHVQTAVPVDARRTTPILHFAWSKHAIPSRIASRSFSTSVAATEEGRYLGGPTALYEQKIRDGLLRPDEYQKTVVAKLQALFDQLATFEPPPIPDPIEYKSVFGKLTGRTVAPKVPEVPENVPKGLYLFGDVGCGKTMLMDLFYESLSSPVVKSKKRIHFHAFMEDVHKRKHRLDQLHKRGGQDLIVSIARELARESEVLCFDEFQVLDIVDAMILKRLIESLLGYGVVIVFTSNRTPNDLYKNGIQRAAFLPCIELIKRQFVVEDLDSGTDYRKIPRALSKVYYDPVEEHRAEFNKLFEAATDGEEVKLNRTVSVWGRDVTIPESTSNTARMTFADLCSRPLSASDYMEITRTFDVIFITDVPQLTLNEKDKARRFILFIDSAYESKTKLFFLSEVPITEIFSDKAPGDRQISESMRATMDDLGLPIDAVTSSTLFSGAEEVFAFARAVSRLTEMKTKFWSDYSK